MTDTMVRMGELAATGARDEQLVTLGLGSCIGLALLDRRAGIAGLAHIVLPGSGGNGQVNQFKFAGRAVPELIDRVVALGARRAMLEAVLVGGASMFAAIGRLDGDRRAQRGRRPQRARGRTHRRQRGRHRRRSRTLDPRRPRRRDGHRSARPAAPTPSFTPEPKLPIRTLQEVA